MYLFLLEFQGTCPDKSVMEEVEKAVEKAVAGLYDSGVQPVGMVWGGRDITDEESRALRAPAP